MNLMFSLSRCVASHYVREVMGSLILNKIRATEGSEKVWNRVGIKHKTTSAFQSRYSEDDRDKWGRNEGDMDGASLCGRHSYSCGTFLAVLSVHSNARPLAPSHVANDHFAPGFTLFAMYCRILHAGHLLSNDCKCSWIHLRSPSHHHSVSSWIHNAWTLLVDRNASLHICHQCDVLLCLQSLRHAGNIGVAIRRCWRLRSALKLQTKARRTWDE